MKKIGKYLKTNKKKILLFLLTYFLIFLFKTIYCLRHYDFGQDLARDLFLMQSAIDQKQLLMFYGPKASVGNFYLFPAYYQISLLLSYLTNNHYLTMSFFVIFLESFSPILIHLILNKLDFKKSISIALSFIYLVSPLVTIFSSFAWNPNTIPFLSILILYLQILYLKDDNKLSLLLIPILLFLAISFHLQAVVLFLSFFIFSIYIFVKNKKDLIYIMNGGFIAFILFSPYLLGEYRNDFANTRSILNYLSAEHSHYYQRVSKLDYLFNFFPSFFERVLFHQELKFNFIGRIIFYLGILCFIKTAFKKRGIILFVLINFISIFLMLRVYKGDKIDYYMSVLFVFPVFLLAFIYDSQKKIALLLMIMTVFLSGRYYSSLSYNNELSNKMEIINYLREEFPENNLRLLIHDDNDINSMVYLIEKKTDLNIDQNSLSLLEILPKGISCEKTFNIKECLAYPGSTYSNLLMEKTNAKRTASRYFDKADCCVNFWELKTNDHNIGYNLYSYNFDYGTDVLRAELYEK